jgi:hypothetical protein
LSIGLQTVQPGDIAGSRRGCGLLLSPNQTRILVLESWVYDHLVTFVLAVVMDKLRIGNKQFTLEI